MPVTSECFTNAKSQHVRVEAMMNIPFKKRRGKVDNGGKNKRGEKVFSGHMIKELESTK